MNQEKRIKQEISEILKAKSSVERRHYAREMNAYIYTESRRISDLEIEESLKGEQHVYSPKNIEEVLDIWNE